VARRSVSGEGRTSARSLVPVSLPPGVPSDDEVRTSLRARATTWIALLIAAFGLGQGLLLALHALGLWHVASFERFERPWTLAAVGAGAGVLALVYHRRFSPSERSRAATVVAVAVALAIGLLLPAHYFDVVVPAIAWAPVLIAAATCEIAWIPGTFLIVFGSTLVQHGWVPALRSPSALVTTMLILGLVVLVRWLHDTGLREAAAAHARALSMTFHDPLTGLPNRHRFVQRLERALLAAALPGQGLAVLRVDLDEFGPLNRALGRPIGDAVLRSVADELVDAAGPSLVARSGADDFLILLTDLPGPAPAEQLAEQLLVRLQIPREHRGRSLHLTARIGVAFALPGEVAEAESLVQRAERAMSALRVGGRSRIWVGPEPTASRSDDRHFQISQALRGATERGELRLVYQPIVHLASGRVSKGEALARWSHPELGEVGPAEFIPVAEANGTIHEIGDWVLAEAARQAAAWRKEGASDFVVSVNRSPIQFRADGDGEHPCLAQLRALGVAADCIALELTEGIFLDTDASTKERLEALRRAGVGLSLDDFGTGYSSIGHLHGFELDLVKIDRRFVQGIVSSDKDRVLCKSIIAMAHALEVKVVAEGVETEAQRDLLAELGCDYVQGYLFGRPMSAERMQALVLAPDGARLAEPAPAPAPRPALRPNS